MSVPKINELGNKYGALIVIAEERDKNGRSAWLCQCDCGNTKVVRGSDLRSGRITSCGCRSNIINKRSLDITNQRFGYLTAIKYEYSKNNKRYWSFQCDCGEIIYKPIGDVISGHTSSCGCQYLDLQSKSHIILEQPGTIYGFLKVISKSQPFILNHQAHWRCLCLNCGKELDVPGIALRSGQAISCGCLISPKEELISHILNDNNISYQRQYKFDDLLSPLGYNLRFDFAIFNIDNTLLGLIEYQGQQHFKKYGFESQQRFNARQEYDLIKLNYCNDKKIPILYLDKNSSLAEEVKKFYNENKKG